MPLTPSNTELGPDRAFPIATSPSRLVGLPIPLSCGKTGLFLGGLGAFVDADLTKEGARLHALVIRQQLRVQTLALASSAPQALLSLLR